jgi:hypothetical protein
LIRKYGNTISIQISTQQQQLRDVILRSPIRDCVGLIGNIEALKPIIDCEFIFHILNHLSPNTDDEQQKFLFSSLFVSFKIIS